MKRIHLLFLILNLCFFNVHVQASLVAHWALDESFPSVVANESIGDFDGSLQGFSGNPWISSPIGGGLNFDGVNDHVAVGDVDSLENFNQVTLSAWINTEGFVSDRHGILVKEFAYKIDLEGSKVRFLVGRLWDNWSGDRMLSSGDISLNRWHHIAATFDGQYKKIYIDGQLDSTLFAPIVGDIGSSTNPILLGARQNSSGLGKFFKGSIDDAAIFDHALSQNEIQYIMTHGATAIPEPITCSLLALGACVVGRKRLR